MNYLINNTEEKNDIIYVGASRALRDIDPRIVQSVTGLKGYNFGLTAVQLYI